jgi:GR25 family glycosyltransferase involved in LPS biosynthesis
MQDLVDGIYVINMDKDTQRLTEFSQVMANSGWSFKRQAAVNGKQLLTRRPETVSTTERALYDEHIRLRHKYVRSLTWLSHGEIGCLLSHVILWEKVATDPTLNRIAIFEDDARTHLDGTTVDRHVTELYQYLSQENIPEPDVLYLGKALDDCLNYEKVVGHVYRSVHPLCLHAYIITKKGAQRLLDMAPYLEAIDIIPIRAIAKGKIDTMVFHPSLFFQDIFGTTSNLRQLKRALNNTTECIVSQQYISESTWTYLVIIIIGLIAVIILFSIYHNRL